MNVPACGERRVLSVYLKPECTRPAGHDGAHAAPACTWAASPDVTGQAEAAA